MPETFCPQCRSGNVSGPAIEAGATVGKYRCRTCEHRWSHPLEADNTPPTEDPPLTQDIGETLGMPCPHCGGSVVLSNAS